MTKTPIGKRPAIADGKPINLNAKVKRNIHIHAKRTTMVLAQGFWDWYDQLAGKLNKPLDELLEMLPYGTHINFSDIARVAAIETSMRELKQLNLRYRSDELRDSASQFPSIYHQVCEDLKWMEEAAAEADQAN